MILTIEVDTLNQESVDKLIQLVNGGLSGNNSKVSSDLLGTSDKAIHTATRSTSEFAKEEKKVTKKPEPKVEPKKVVKKPEVKKEEPKEEKKVTKKVEPEPEKDEITLTVKDLQNLAKNVAKKIGKEGTFEIIAKFSEEGAKISNVPTEKLKDLKEAFEAKLKD